MCQILLLLISLFFPSLLQEFKWQQNSSVLLGFQLSQFPLQFASLSQVIPLSLVSLSHMPHIFSVLWQGPGVSPNFALFLNFNLGFTGTAKSTIWRVVFFLLTKNRSSLLGWNQCPFFSRNSVEFCASHFIGQILVYADSFVCMIRFHNFQWHHSNSFVHFDTLLCLISTRAYYVVYNLIFLTR